MIPAVAEKRPFLRIDEKDFDALGLHEGDTVELIVAKRNGAGIPEPDRAEQLRLLAATRGIWADDENITKALAELETTWSKWRQELMQS